jgi:hypothetical protein
LWLPASTQSKRRDGSGHWQSDDEPQALSGQKYFRLISYHPD